MIKKIKGFLVYRLPLFVGLAVVIFGLSNMVIAVVEEEWNKAIFFLLFSVVQAAVMTQVAGWLVSIEKGKR